MSSAFPNLSKNHLWFYFLVKIFLIYFYDSNWFNDPLLRKLRSAFKILSSLCVNIKILWSNSQLWPSERNSHEVAVCPKLRKIAVAMSSFYHSVHLTRWKLLSYLTLKSSMCVSLAARRDVTVGNAKCHRQAAVVAHNPAIWSCYNPSCWKISFNGQSPRFFIVFQTVFPISTFCFNHSL